MVSAEEKMDKQIQKITFPKSTPVDRLEAYQALLRSFQEEDVSPNFLASAGQILAVMKRDISSENNALSQESLHFLGIFLNRENVVSSIESSKLKDIIDELCNLIVTCKEKVVSSRSLWCLAKQRIPLKICIEKIDKVLQTIEYTAKNSAQSSASTELEAIRVLTRLVTDIPDSMAVRIRIWARRLYLAAVHPNAKVREAAVTAVYNARALYQKNQQELLSTMVPDLKDVLVPGMLRLFRERQELHSLKLWNLLIEILGKTLHQGASLINSLLAVVEKAFKSISPEVKIAAFRSWQQLIVNFGIELEVIANPKRLRLVMQPLKANNARTEQVAITKFSVWWNLAVVLKAKLPPNFEMVVYPLLQFCFGSGEGSAINQQATSPGNVSANMSTSTQFNMSTNSSVASSGNAQNFSSLNRLGSEALAHILGYGLSLPVSKPAFSIAVLTHPVLVPPTNFLRHSQVLISSVKEAIANLNADKKDLHLQLYLWHAIIAHIRANADSENRKEVAEAVTAFLSNLEDFVQSKSVSPDVVLKLLEASTLLPLKILNSPSFSVRNASVMKGTPALFLMTLLFDPLLLELSSTQERFTTVFQKLVSIGLSSSATSLGFAYSVLTLLDSSVDDIGHSDTIYQMWSTIVYPLLESIQKTQEVNQGDALEHEFGCMYAVLLFPIKHLFNKPLLQNSVKTLLRIWNDLYRTFSRCAALVPNVESNTCCDEFAAKVVGILSNDKLQDPLVLVNLTHLLNGLVSVLDFSPSALQTVSNNIGLMSPGKWMKPKQKPLGNFNSLVKLLDIILTSIYKWELESRSEENTETTSQMKTNQFTASCNVAEVVKVLFSHVNTSSLIGPLLTKLAKPLSLLFQDPGTLDVSKVQQGQFTAKLEAMWAAVTLCVQQHYTGPYDSDLLACLSPLFEVTLIFPRKMIKTKARALWYSMFAQSLDTLKLPESLVTVLKQTKPALVPGLNVGAEDTEKFSSLQEGDSQELPETARQPQKMRGSFLTQSPGNKPSEPRKTLGDSLSTPKRQSRLDELSNDDFVKIAPTPKRRRILTEHQKEKFSTRREVPAMYVDLSQDQSQVPLQSLEETQTQSVSVIEEIPVIKTVSESNVPSKTNSDITATVSPGTTTSAITPTLPTIEVEEIVDKHTRAKEFASQDSVVVIEETQLEQDVIPPETIMLKSSSDSSGETVIEGMDDKEQTGSSVSNSSTGRSVVDRDSNSPCLLDSNVESEITQKYVSCLRDEVAIAEPSFDDAAAKCSHEMSSSSEGGNEGDVALPEVVTADEKLRSKPILEITRLTEKEIIEHQHSAQQPSEGECDTLDSVEAPESNLVSQEIVVLDAVGEKQPVTKASYKYVGKLKIGNNISASTKMPISVSDEDVIPSSQNTNSSGDKSSQVVTADVQENPRVEMPSVEETVDGSIKAASQPGESQQLLEDMVDEMVTKAEEYPVFTKKVLRKKEVIQRETTDSPRVTRSVMQLNPGPGRRRRLLVTNTEVVMPIKKKLRQKGKKKSSEEQSSEDQPVTEVENLSEEVANTEAQESVADSDQSSKGLLGQAAQEHLASFSSADSINKVEPEKTTQFKKYKDEPKKNKTARKSVQPILRVPVSQTPAETVRSRRSGKKSLKTKMADEYAPVSSGRTRSHSLDGGKNKISLSSRKQAALDFKKSCLIDEDTNQLCEQIEIDNSQPPTANIELLVKSRILNTIEPEGDILTVADMVEIPCKSDTNVPKPGEISNVGVLLSSDDVSAETVTVIAETDSDVIADNDGQSKPTIDDAVITEIPVKRTRRKSRVVKVLDETKCNLDHESNEAVEFDSKPNIKIKTASGNEESTCRTTKDTDLEDVLLPTEASHSDAAESVMFVSFSNGPDTPIENADVRGMIVTSEVEIACDNNSSSVVPKTSVSDDDEDNNVHTETCDTESSMLMKEDTSKLNESDSSAESSPRTRRKSAASLAERDRLLKGTSKEDDTFKFVAQRNMKTYSRDVQRVQPLQTLSTTDSSGSKSNISPLMQRIGSSRTVRMLEAAAKKNAKYEKMKYEQRRSPDRSSGDNANVVENDEKCNTFQSPHAVLGASQNSDQPGSTSSSPSGGILKRRRQSDGTVTPSPRRRVSFADPLVQDQVDTGKQGTHRGVHRSLEMNQSTEIENNAANDLVAFPPSPTKKDSLKEEGTSITKKDNVASSGAVNVIDSDIYKLSTEGVTGAAEGDFPDTEAIESFPANDVVPEDVFTPVVESIEVTTETLVNSVEIDGAETTQLDFADSQISGVEQEVPITSDGEHPAALKTVAFEEVCIGNVGKNGSGSIVELVSEAQMEAKAEATIECVGESVSKFVSPKKRSFMDVSKSDVAYNLPTDESDAGEPEGKKRRVDLMQRVEDLYSVFTSDNLNELPTEKMMQLQQQLCNMTMAVTSAALEKSTSVSESPE